MAFTIPPHLCPTMALRNLKGDTPCIAAITGSITAGAGESPSSSPHSSCWVFLAISSGGPLWVAGAVGAALFVPLLVFKLFFIAFVFGAAMRFVGGGFPGPMSRREPEPPTEEQLEWEEHLREARREVDELFPDA